MKEAMGSASARKTNSRAEAAMISAFAAGVALLLMMAGTAHANVAPAPPATASTIAGCNKLPLNQIEFCKSQVGWTELARPHVAIDRTASARTASEMAACRNLPLSTKYMCEDQAGYGQAVPRQSLAISAKAVLRKEDQRYHVALAACTQRPYSAVSTVACMSAAGQDPRLAATG